MRSRPVVVIILAGLASLTSLDGRAQITRWLNVSGSIEDGPGIFYDPEDPFQGTRRALDFQVGLQPNAS